MYMKMIDAKNAFVMGVPIMKKKMFPIFSLILALLVTLASACSQDETPGQSGDGTNSTGQSSANQPSDAAMTQPPSPGDRATGTRKGEEKRAPTSDAGSKQASAQAGKDGEPKHKNCKSREDLLDEFEAIAVDKDTRKEARQHAAQQVARSLKSELEKGSPEANERMAKTIAPQLAEIKALESEDDRVKSAVTLPLTFLRGKALSDALNKGGFSKDKAVALLDSPEAAIRDGALITLSRFVTSELTSPREKVGKGENPADLEKANLREREIYFQKLVAEFKAKKARPEEGGDLDVAFRNLVLYLISRNDAPVREQLTLELQKQKYREDLRTYAKDVLTEAESKVLPKRK
jgi:hypothetical protein